MKRLLLLVVFLFINTVHALCGELTVAENARVRQVREDMLIKGISQNTALSYAIKVKLDVYTELSYNSMSIETLNEINKLLAMQNDADKRVDYYIQKMQDFQKEQQTAVRKEVSNTNGGWNPKLGRIR